MLGIFLLHGCATAEMRLGDGRTAFAQGRWQDSIDAFDDFDDDACRVMSPDVRCRETRLQKAEAYLRLGAPTRAFWILDALRADAPSPDPLQTRADHVQRDVRADLISHQKRTAGDGCVLVHITSRTASRMRFKAVRFFVDMEAQPGDWKPVDESTVVRVASVAKFAAGEHQIAVRAAYAGAEPELTGYKFSVESFDTFRIDPGRVTAIEIEVREIRAWRDWRNALEVSFQMKDRGPDSCVLAAP